MLPYALSTLIAGWALACYDINFISVLAKYHHVYRIQSDGYLL